MVVGNVGMAILAVVSCLKPRAVFYPFLQVAESDREMLGIPESLKYHKGHKRWKLEVGEAVHSFENKIEAIQVCQWLSKTKRSLELLTGKVLLEELKAAGLKVGSGQSRSKPALVESVLRLRYKQKGDHLCACCVKKAQLRFSS